MVSPARPDVYFTETLLNAPPSAGPSTPVPTFVGKCWKGPLTPTLVRSFSEFQQVFGGFPGVGQDAPIIPWSAWLFSANQGGEFYVSRVLAVDSAVATFDVVDDGDEVDTSEVHLVAITGGPSGGTITATGGGSSTGAAPVALANAHTATAAAVKAHIETMPGVAAGDVVTVTGVDGGPWTVTWKASLGNVDPLTFSHVLTGGTTPDIGVTTPTAGVAGTALPTLQVDAFSPGVWGDEIRAQFVDRDEAEGRFDLLVYYGGATGAFLMERHLDLSMDPTDQRYVVGVINSVDRGSSYINVTDLETDTAAPFNAPGVGTFQLAGGSEGATVDDDDHESAIDRLAAISLPLIIAVPGASATVINAAVAFASGRQDSFVVVDSVESDTPSEATTFAASLTSSSYGSGPYYPWLVVQDPSVNRTGVRKTVPPSGAVMGQYVQNDRERTPAHTPAGVARRLSGVIDLETALSATDLDNLNDGHVNALRPEGPAGGICVMGGRTLKRSGVDRFIGGRRGLIYLRNGLIAVTEFAIFEDNDTILWEILTDRCNTFLKDFWLKRGLYGEQESQAFFVRCDETVNTPQTIEQGEVRVQVGVRLQYPAEFVIIDLAQWSGGSSVNIAA
jgi:hypothetical protein